MSQQVCEMAAKCPLFNIYPVSKLNDLKWEYCVGNKHLCERYRLKMSGQEVPLHLLPNGEYYEEDGSEQDVHTVI